MSSFEHAGWRWQSLSDAPEELVADVLTSGLLGSVSLTADELRHLAKTKDEPGEDLTVIASRSGQVDAVVGFPWNTKFLDMTVVVKGGAARDLLEGLAGIGAYIRDRTEQVMCVDPNGAASDVTRFFSGAYETGYMQVIEPHELDVPFTESGPPTVVLKGACSAPPMESAAQISLDQMLARYAFLGFEL